MSQSNNMNLQQFLKCVDQGSLVGRWPVICFRGERDYPLLFFSLLFSRLKAADMLVETVDLVADDTAAVKARMATSFLGQSVFYWLRDFTTLSKQTRDHWCTYTQQYNGSNTIAFFVDQATAPVLSDKSIYVDVPSNSNKALFVDLIQFFHQPLTTRNKQLITTIFKKNATIPLDTACILMEYILLLGNKTDGFIDDWLDRLVVSETSLFLLSQHFFAKDRRAFFSLWPSVADKYSELFWISFWSEQIWRSYNFVRLMQENNYAEAKKAGFRLPFSFLRYDWKNFSLLELRQAHHAMYKSDYSFKNGGMPCALDLFYTSFFLNKYSN